MTWVNDAVQQVKARRPSAFTIDDLDGELGTMALLRALPEDFRSFTSSLMLLPQLDYPTVKDAVFLEEQNHQPRPSDAPIALNTANVAQTSKSLSCTFCNATGHVVDTCDAHRLWTTIFLRNKSDAFPALNATKHLWKTILTTRSKLCEMTREGNICQMSLVISWPLQAFPDSTLCAMSLTKME
jgi:hypothetical protein